MKAPSAGAPVRELEQVVAAQARFEAAIAALGDEAAAAPSALPGWTRGHLLTHVARNADSHVRRIGAAIRGEVVEQYVGGYAGREREIDEGARRPAAALVADVRDTAARLRAAWSEVPGPAWSTVTRDVGGRERPLAALPARRWQELEVHVVDLDLGVTHRTWSDDFVAVFLPKLRDTMAARLPAGSEVVASGALDERDELAWLYGRLRPAGLPELAPWG